MNNIETLIDEGGSISIADLAPIGCVAAASDGSNCLAMLVRCDGESLSDLMARLDAMTVGEPESLVSGASPSRAPPLR